jgi:hypothetical protein
VIAARRLLAPMLAAAVAAAPPAAAATAAATPAAAKSATSATSDRTAVFIASGAGTEPALGDNLNEVAIAKLAEHAPGERVGTHELRRWMEKTGDGEPVPTCISRTPCLRRLGAELGVRKVISGSVLADGGEFTIALTLLDAESGAVEVTSTKTVSGEVEQVIRAVQDAMVELLRPKVAATRLALTADPTSASSGSPKATVVVTAERPAESGRGWPFYAGVGAAAASIVSLSAAGFFGVMAMQEPSGADRAAMQRDLATHDGYATAANSLWIVGGTLGLAAVALLVWPRLQSGGR